MTRVILSLFGFSCISATLIGVMLNVPSGALQMVGVLLTLGVPVILLVELVYSVRSDIKSLKKVLQDYETDKDLRRGTTDLTDDDGLSLQEVVISPCHSSEVIHSQTSEVENTVFRSRPASLYSTLTTETVASRRHDDRMPLTDNFTAPKSSSASSPMDQSKHSIEWDRVLLRQDTASTTATRVPHQDMAAKGPIRRGTS